MYEYKGDLMQNKLSSIPQKRNYGSQEMKLNNVVATKRDFPDTRALDLARAKAAEPDATNLSVLQALFELLIGEKNPTAARAAMALPTIIRASPYEWHSRYDYYILNGPSSINDDAIPFVIEFSQYGYYYHYTLGITLALIPQPNRRLLGHTDFSRNLEIADPILSPLQIGKGLLQLGNSFSYAGPFPTSLVVEVVVAALAVTDGTAKTPQDIVQIMSQLSQ